MQMEPSLVVSKISLTQLSQQLERQKQMLLKLNFINWQKIKLRKLKLLFRLRLRFHEKPVLELWWKKSWE